MFQKGTHILLCQSPTPIYLTLYVQKGQSALLKQERRPKKGKGKHPSKQRYSTYDVVHVIQEAKIKTRLELIGLAVEQEKEGKTKLAEFIANKGRQSR